MMELLRKFGERLPDRDIQLIIDLYFRTNGNSREAERMLGEEPYFSEGQNHASSTIREYWARRGLRVRRRGEIDAPVQKDTPV